MEDILLERWRREWRREERRGAGQGQGQGQGQSRAGWLSGLIERVEQARKRQAKGGQDREGIRVRLGGELPYSKLG